MFDHVVVKRGNIFDSEMESITITTNTVAVMGAGLAKAAKTLYPSIEPIYKRACKLNHHTVEKPLIIPVEDKKILCFATKKHWQNPSDKRWIESGLKWIVENQEQLKSIAIPPLGCGLGGLNYRTDLRPLFIEYLALMDIPVELYNVSRKK